MIKIHNPKIKRKGLSPESFRTSLCMCSLSTDTRAHKLEGFSSFEAKEALVCLQSSDCSRNRERVKKAKCDMITYCCFLILSVSLLGSFKLPLLVVLAILLSLQPLMLILFIAVIPEKENICQVLLLEIQFCSQTNTFIIKMFLRAQMKRTFYFLKTR